MMYPSYFVYFWSDKEVSQTLRQYGLKHAERLPFVPFYKAFTPFYLFFVPIFVVNGRDSVKQTICN